MFAMRLIIGCAGFGMFVAAIVTSYQTRDDMAVCNDNAKMAALFLIAAAISFAGGWS